MFNNLTGTPRYLSWLARELRPNIGDEVLEIGAGIGNIAGRLMGERTLYMAGEKDPLHLHALRNRFLRAPNVEVRRLDPEVPEDWAGLERRFDTILCLNVLEYVEHPNRVLAFLGAALKPNGSAVILVPNGPGLFGTLDRSLGHQRRYTAAGVRRLLESQGFAVGSIRSFNKAGAPPWWAYSKILGSRSINKAVLKIFDKTIWFWSRVDRLMPWPGLTLIAVAHPPGDSGVSGAASLATSAKKAG